MKIIKKINLYKIIRFSLWTLFITGVLYIIFWLIRPSQFLNFGIGIPHAIISIIFFIMVPIFLLVGKLIYKQINFQLKKTVIFYLVNIIIYLFIAFSHPISVSEITLKNQTNSDLENILILCPGDKIEILKLEKNTQIQVPIIPNTEGSLGIQGNLDSGKLFKYNTFIPECCPSNYIYIIKSADNIKIIQKDIKTVWFTLFDNLISN